jgi:hypothetical protein
MGESITAAWICRTVRQFSLRSSLGAAKRRWRIAQGGAKGGTLGTCLDRLEPCKGEGIAARFPSPISGLPWMDLGSPRVPPAAPPWATIQRRYAAFESAACVGFGCSFAAVRGGFQPARWSLAFSKNRCKKERRLEAG